MAATLGLWVGCAHHQKDADKAFMLGDYEQAAAKYELALADTDEPHKLASLQRQLHEARRRAAAVHLGRARDRLAVNDAAAALIHAQKASEYESTPDTQTLLADLRTREGVRLLQEGRIAHGVGRWDDAVRDLQAAQALAPSEDGARLLLEARSRAEEHHSSRFLSLLESAQQSLNARDWATAVSRFQAAHQHGGTPESQRAHEFAELMLKAEVHWRKAAHDASAAAQAEAIYHKAMELGLDGDFVQHRLKMVSRAAYRITIHSAVVLPFKRDTGAPWDGVGARGDVSGALKLLASKVSGPQTNMVALGSEAMRWASAGVAAPDCYVSVSLDGLTIGGRQTTDHDDARPTWNLSLDVRSTSGIDERTVTIEVRDADEADDDNIGAVQIPLGELVMGGTQVIPLLSRDGDLLAGALLALKVSAQRL